MPIWGVSGLWPLPEKGVWPRITFDIGLLIVKIKKVWFVIQHP